MTSTQSSPQPRVGGMLLAGAVLEATAAVIGLTGLTVCAIALAARVRHRMAHMEVPPTQLARRHLARARAATAAGVGAWRGTPAASPGVHTDGAGRTGDTSRMTLREPADV